MHAEARLKAAKLELPPPPAPLGAYVPAVQAGNLLFLTGMVPVAGHEVKFVGRVGKELTAEQGRSAAYVAGLAALATARQYLGSLDKIARVVRVGVSIATADDGLDMPWIADGASELFRDVFGADRMSTRMVIGVQRLPLGVPIELEVIFDLSPQEPRQ